MTTLSAAEIWLTIGLMAAGTLALRFSFIALAGRMGRLTPVVGRILRLIPAAALAALAAPALLRPDGPFDPTWGNERLLAGLVAALVAWRWRNVFVTIAAGMTALWVLQAVGA